MVHALKTDSSYFEHSAAGLKGFEVRKNDRPYKAGDYIVLNEWINDNYTGRFILHRIIYILEDPQYCKEGYIILGLAPCAIRENNDPFSRGIQIPVYDREFERRL